jgi:hypothetical protein
VIDIPQGLKDDFENERWTALTCAMMKDALEEGTVLPKGHGRLIDADELSLTMAHMIDRMFVCDAPTIIEADKAGEEE